MSLNGNDSISREPAPGPGIGRTIAAVVLLLLATSLYFGSGRAQGEHTTLRAFPLDDSYIHLVYATSLVERGRFEYNRGEPEAGMSSLLWVIAQSPFVLASRVSGVSVVLMVHFLNHLLSLGLALCMMVWAREVSGSRFTGFLAAAAVLFEPALAFSRFAGMEVLLGAFLMSAAYFAWQRERRLLAGVLLALAVLTRLENLVLVGLCFMAEIPDKERFKRCSAVVLPTAVALAAWFLYNWAVTGRPLPNTFYVKGRTGLDIIEAARMVRHMVFACPYFVWVAGFVLYIAGCALMFMKHGLRAAPAVLFPWVFILGLASSRHGFSNYWAYYFHRYFQPCIPFLLIPWVLGAAWAAGTSVKSLRSDTRLGLTEKVLVFTAFAVVAVSVIPWPGRMSHWRELLAWNCSNIEDIHVRLGKWVALNTGPEDVIAVVDAGAVRYYGGRYTLDLIGLNNHGMVAAPMETFFGTRPDYMILPDEDQDGVLLPGWLPFPLGDKTIYLKQVFFVDPVHYTITRDFPGRQTVYKVIYRNH